MPKTKTKTKIRRGSDGAALAAALTQQRELRRARDLQRKITLLSRQLRGAVKQADAARAAAADALCDGSDYSVYEIALIKRISDDNESLRKDCDEAAARVRELSKICDAQAEQLTALAVERDELRREAGAGVAP